MDTENLDVHISWFAQPEDDLALEESLIDRAAAGHPQLFLYSWNDPVLVLGYGQQASDEMLRVSGELGIPVLKRRTGGTGVLQQRDLNVSLALPATHPWSKGIGPLYKRFVGAIETALADVGRVTTMSDIPVKSAVHRSHICFEDHAIETLLWNDRKVLGCAQGRRRGGVLVHGTLISGAFDSALQARVFGVSKSRIERAIGSLDLDQEKLPDLVTELIRQISLGLNADARIRGSEQVAIGETL